MTQKIMEQLDSVLITEDQIGESVESKEVIEEKKSIKEVTIAITDIGGNMYHN